MRLPRRLVAGRRTPDLRFVVAVSEGLDIYNYAVRKPNTLHQHVRTEIVRPHFDLNGRASDQIGLTYGSSPAGVQHATVNLSWVTAESGNFRAAFSLIDDLIS